MNFLEKYNIYLTDKDLLLRALTHTSYANEHDDVLDYERLEFLGDAVLELIVSDYLYSSFDYPEGEMTKLRSSYVCEKALYEYAKVVGYIPYIRVGNGQMHDVNETIIADVFEAILAVIYLEKGYEVSKKYVLDVVAPFIDKKAVFYSDYKSMLQEAVQTDKKSLQYRMVKEMGPAHDKTYVFEVLVDDIVLGVGSGKSKKDAEQKAALDAYKKCVKK